MKTWVRDRLGQLTAQLTAQLAAELTAGLTAQLPAQRDAGPELLADQLSLVMEGVYASAQALSARGPARHARVLAELVLNAA
jgi:hypothetical protein